MKGCNIHPEYLQIMSSCEQNKAAKYHTKKMKQSRAPSQHAVNGFKILVNTRQLQYKTAGEVLVLPLLEQWEMHTLGNY